MSVISPAAVKELRQRTDLPMGDCKSALVEAGGDMDKAIEIIRSKFAKLSVKREGNETAEGRVGVFIDAAKQVAAIVEMRCESAPSAKSDQFVALATDVAKHVVAADPKDVATALTQPFAGGAGTLQTRIEDTVGVIREKMIAHKFTRLAGGVFGEYVHHDGTVGVLLQTKGTGGGEVLRDVAAHIAALNPPYATIASVPAEVVEKEKAFVAAEMAADPKHAGKPASIIEKVTEGKLRTRLAEVVLTEQPMANGAKYPNATVGQSLKKAGLEVVGFVRYKVGAVAL